MVISCCTIFLNPTRLYNKRQTIADEIEKCLDEGLEPNYHFSIFNHKIVRNKVIFTYDITKLSRLHHFVVVSNRIRYEKGKDF